MRNNNEENNILFSTINGENKMSKNNEKRNASTPQEKNVLLNSKK